MGVVQQRWTKSSWYVQNKERRTEKGKADNIF